MKTRNEAIGCFAMEIVVIINLSQSGSKKSIQCKEVQLKL